MTNTKTAINRMEGRVLLTAAKDVAPAAFLQVEQILNGEVATRIYQETGVALRVHLGTSAS